MACSQSTGDQIGAGFPPQAHFLPMHICHPALCSSWAIFVGSVQLHLKREQPGGMGRIKARFQSHTPQLPVRLQRLPSPLSFPSWVNVKKTPSTSSQMPFDPGWVGTTSSAWSGEDRGDIYNHRLFKWGWVFNGVMFRKLWECPVVKDCSVKLSKGRFTQNVLKVLHLQCFFGDASPSVCARK